MLGRVIKYYVSKNQDSEGIQLSVELGLAELETTGPKSGFYFSYIADIFSHFNENMFQAYDYLMYVRFAYSSKMGFITHLHIEGILESRLKDWYN